MGWKPAQRTALLNATDAADYLCKTIGVPFRDAYGIIGQLVLLCINENKALDDLTLEQFKSISPVFEEDILRCDLHEDMRGETRDSSALRVRRR